MIAYSFIRNKWVRRSSTALQNYYRSCGISIGENCVFRSPGSTQLDLMRPALIKIGDNVDMNRNFSIMTHDFSHRVFLYKYGEFLSSSGRVTVGSNIYFGMNVTILKGVTIGDNCVIGAGSIVTKDIPANSVAVDVPCKVICSLDDYFEKRQRDWVNEALDYVCAYRERFHRDPTIDDFRPEFGVYADASNIERLDKSPIISRLGEQYGKWLSKHKAPFHDFKEFIEAAKNICKEK